MREKWFLAVMTMYLKPWLLYEVIVIWCRKWAVGEKCPCIERKCPIEIEQKNKKRLRGRK